MEEQFRIPRPTSGIAILIIMVFIPILMISILFLALSTEGAEVGELTNLCNTILAIIFIIGIMFCLSIYLTVKEKRIIRRFVAKIKESSDPVVEWESRFDHDFYIQAHKILLRRIKRNIHGLIIILPIYIAFLVIVFVNFGFIFITLGGIFTLSGLIVLFGRSILFYLKFLRMMPIECKNDDKKSLWPLFTILMGIYVLVICGFSFISFAEDDYAFLVGLMAPALIASIVCIIWTWVRLSITFKVAG